ncbi:MAG: hypothetical protein ACREJM_10895, partial [Candidatus Saccharimonadales bacterium]
MGMRRKPTSSGKLRLVGVLSATCCLLAIGIAALLPYRQALLARYWEAELTRAPDERVGEVLKKLAALDEPGIGALARALNSSRKIVSELAYNALSEEINACTRLTPLEANDRMSALAVALAAGAEQSPAARGAAARLAVRILLWPGESGLERGRLVADCERVLQAAGAPVAARVNTASTAPQSAGRRLGDVHERAAAPRRGDGEVLANLPGEELPLADLAPPALGRAATERLAEPARFDDTDSAAMAGRSPDAAGQDPNDEWSVGDLSPVSPAKAERGAGTQLKALDTLALFAQLHESD